MYKIEKLFRCFFLSSLLLCFYITTAQAQSVLQKKLNLKVYASERLESVIFRIEANLGIRIGFKVVDFIPYKAKPADYKEATVSQILDEQLEETSFAYSVNKGKLFIKKKTDKQLVDRNRRSSVTFDLSQP
ncbi:MAG TPA: hypothetical protein VN040_15995 [Pseudosphingobacterium sp.]|nr:hypothetical protein [Pseudosphingobacterium sp.]